MNKADLIHAVAAATGEARAHAAAAVEATLEAVQSALAKGETVALTGFGSFTPKKRAARTGRNPQTGATLQIPATTIPVFKAGQTLKDLVSGKAKLTATKTN